MGDNKKTNKIEINKDLLGDIILGVACLGTIIAAAVSIKSYNDGFDDGVRYIRGREMNVSKALKVIKKNFRLGVLAQDIGDFVYGVNKILEDEAELNDVYYTKIRLASN